MIEERKEKGEEEMKEERKEDGKEEREKGKGGQGQMVEQEYYVLFEFSDKVVNILPHRGTVVFVLSFQNQFLPQ